MEETCLLALDDPPTSSFSHEVLIAEQVSIRPIEGRVVVYIYGLLNTGVVFLRLSWRKNMDFMTAATSSQSVVFAHDDILPNQIIKEHFILRLERSG